MAEFTDQDRASGLEEISKNVREIRAMQNRIGSWVEERLANADMPAIKFTKRELRTDRLRDRPEVNPDEELSLRPVKPAKTESNWWVDLQWEMERTNGENENLPKVTAEEISDEKLEKYGNILPRPHRKRGNDEKMLIFKNEAGEVAGRINIVEGRNGDSCRLRYLETATPMEHQGYGSAILSYLKTKYESISLTQWAYWEDSKQDWQKRLEGFYVMNGFCFASDGMGWNRNWVTYEDLKAGEKAIFTDEAIIGGDNISKGWLMKKYLEKLDKMGKLDEILGKNDAMVARSWIALRSEEDRLMDVQEDLIAKREND